MSSLLLIHQGGRRVLSTSLQVSRVTPIASLIPHTKPVLLTKSSTPLLSRSFQTFKRPLIKYKTTQLLPIMFSSGLVTISSSIKQALTKDEIIPTVIHEADFTPKGFLMIQYGSEDKQVTMGNTLLVKETQERPTVHFTLNLPDDTSSSTSSFKISPDDKFTLVLTDPDAPTKGDEKWSEFCHYVSKDITLNSFNAESVDVSDIQTKLTTQDLKGHDIVPYMGPGPPPKTGKHRYVFLLYKQKSTPADVPDRPNWGSGIPGYGAAEYAAKNGLELLAVNYFFAQNTQQ